ncbi:uncharacterized protein EI90DRAFT_3030900 [Cantharellus anzutake]|uniref:uncharacterized protein n=1 Tax=Cantharellus anzutake TaxID=1750568 RepID=UPI0019037320|nr:uncharacterized protein EI90DRAFT_3030900 [Cantharellus anzutake]KAF8342970.1 hypothetical protein EI90DRAFT_3030900 [Cantharellus anzutake]
MENDRDPYLDFQPNFALSLPVQILLQGVIVALVSVLLIHLIFTAHSHWPLARLNYALQVAGVTTLLISSIASIIVVLHLLRSYSRGWPYMLDYIAISIPPDDWPIAGQVSWYSMEAITSGFAHITNIQTLTLLFPAKAEQRLIFLLLGPLVLASSAMTFSSLSPTDRAQDLGDAIRGICNTTLSLLFTSALFIWGFVINRYRAWRTDGGTAAFGAGACLLAVMSVVVNFILIFEDRLVWLPYLNWAVVLWQSFFGWWWFAGSGMGIPEVGDMLYRAERNKRKAQEKERKRKRKTFSEVDTPSSNTSGALRFFSSLVGDLSRRRSARTMGPGRDATSGNEGDIEMCSIPSGLAAHQTTVNGAPHPHSRLSNFFHALPFFHNISNFTKELGHAHIRAAVENAQSDPRPEGGESEGWGLGAYGLTQREEAERRIMEFKERRKGQRLLNVERGPGIEEREEDWEDEAGDIGENDKKEALERLQREVDAEAAGPSTSGQQDTQGPRRRPSHSTLTTLPDPLPPTGSVFWWWGPLRRWRLQDRAVYQ